MPREVTLKHYKYVMSHVSYGYHPSNNIIDSTLCGIKNIPFKSPVWAEMYNNTGLAFLNNIKWMCKKCIEKLN